MEKLTKVNRLLKEALAKASQADLPGAPSEDWLSTVMPAIEEHLVSSLTEECAKMTRSEVARHIAEGEPTVLSGAMEALFNALPVFVGIVNRDGSLASSNQDTHPLPAFDPQNLDGDEAAQIPDILNRVFETGVALSCRFARRSADRSRWFEHRIGPVFDAKKNVSAVTWVVLDVTEHVQTHVRVLETQRRRSLELLAGGVAHDFNNLLTAILGNTVSVIADLPPGSPAVVALDDVRTSGIRAAGLSRQLLAFSGKTGNELNRVGVTELVKSLKTAVSGALPPSTHISWRIGDGETPVSADRAQLQHVILQLLLNASEALDGNEGEVNVVVDTIELDATEIAGFILGDNLRPGRYACIEVSDQGHGMDAETRRRMFDPFFTTRFIGRGMGLAASAGITRAHSGGIGVESSRGKGTTVRLFLPLVPGFRPELDEATPVPGDGGEGRRVLIVDDEEVVLRFTRRALERYGFDVTSVTSGADALEAYDKERFDIVLLDMTMPSMSGEETFAALLALDPSVRTVLTSGYNAIEATRRFTSAGLAGFLEKPFSARRLTAKLEEVLASSVTKPH